MSDALCGWWGISDDPQTARAHLERMSARLSLGGSPAVHRLGPEFAIAVVGEPSAPACYSNGDLCAAITGRPYWRHAELADIAERDGYAPALAAAYRKWGPALLAQVRGTYSLAVIDRDAGGVLLATDRFATRPLYYSLDASGRLAFGSTTTSLQSHPAFRSELDPTAVYAYLYFHAVPSPLVIYRGQRRLLPGQYLWHCKREQRLDFHWQPQFQESTEPASALEAQLSDLLRMALRRCEPRADTGAFLSGGIDSSTVAGFLAELVSPAKTFSIGFSAEGYDEMAWARISARHFGTEGHEYYVTPDDVAHTVPLIAQAYDEPFGNSSAVPVYHCARLAREHGIAVMLAGDGGDELFGGNARYAKQKLFELYHRLPPALRAHVLEPALRALPAAGPLRKAQSYVAQARVPMPERLETYNFLHRTPLAEMLDAEFLASIDSEAPQRLLRDTYERMPTTAFVNRMLFLDWKFTLADNDLRKVNRMCERAGIRVRYPLLDDDVVEFSTRVPAALKVKGSKLRYFFKRALRDFLPAEVLSKPKHGFGLPFGVWMRDHAPLQEIAYDSLLRLANRRYLRRDYLERLMRLHREEHAGYYGEFIWVLMMLELWLEYHDH